MLDNLKLQPIENWLKKNNWSFYDHQLETLKHSKNGFDILLVAPTGGGTTLAVFLPSLEDLIENKSPNNKASDSGVVISICGGFCFCLFFL